VYRRKNVQRDRGRNGKTGGGAQQRDLRIGTFERTTPLEKEKKKNTGHRFRARNADVGTIGISGGPGGRLGEEIKRHRPRDEKKKKRAGEKKRVGEGGGIRKTLGQVGPQAKNSFMEKKVVLVTLWRPLLSGPVSQTRGGKNKAGRSRGKK